MVCHLYHWMGTDFLTSYLIDLHVDHYTTCALIIHSIFLTLSNLYLYTKSCSIVQSLEEIGTSLQGDYL